MGTQTSAGLRQATWLSCGLETLVEDCPWMAEPEIPKRSEHDFDVVIVGSGYGGAVAAAELSGCRKLKICVLERGNEYLRGMFPSRQTELPGYIRFATPDAKRQRGIYDGLYDMRWSDDAVALVASGVGGGSLINAGVMEMPKPYVFQEARWPRKIREASHSLEETAEKLRIWLGARQLTTKDASFAKTGELTRLAGLEKVSRVHVTVATEEHNNKAGVALSKCNACGDCATGCNYNAKESLDLNLLCLAHEAGARIVTGATVLRVAPREAGADGWHVYVNHTDGHLRDRQPEPFCLRAKRVILAAGAFGSTEILMRSQNERLQLSSQLGRKFSANGDMLVIAHDLAPGNQVNAVANETVDPKPPGLGRAVGPTITEMIDLRKGNAESDLVIQDLAVPGPLRRLFEEATTTFDVLNRLTAGDWEKQKKGTARDDDAAVEPSAMKRSLVLAMIGRDDAEGELSLGGRPICDDADGLLTVSWPQLRLDRRFEDHHRYLGDLLKKSGAGGRVVNNLLWRPLSAELEDVFGRQRGPLLTVHPLGGCPMGDDVGQGVTDDCGRVFDAADGAANLVHSGLVVLDGSIVPTSLGINPALTIAVLAQRAIQGLKDEWKLEGGLANLLPKRDCSPRPVFSETVTDANPEPTLIELTEQMRGRVKLKGHDWRRQPHEIEITLTTEPVPVADLIDRSPSPGHRRRNHGRRLRVEPAEEGKPAKGKLRILRTGARFDPLSDQPQTKDVVLEADISGWLTLFDFEPSRPWWRIFRVFCAWLLNRGLRDLVQTSIRRLQESLHLLPRLDDLPKQKLSSGKTVLAWLRREWAWIWMSERKDVARIKPVMMRMTVALVVLAALISVPFVLASNWLNGWWKLAYAIAAAVVLGLFLTRSYVHKILAYTRKMLGLFSHAGAVRLIEYDLRIDRVVPRERGLAPKMFEGKSIRGVKRLTYRRCASPFTQLMSMSLEKFPAMRRFIGRKSPKLEFNKRYVARQEVPLLRVVGQQDGFAALIDLLSFALYVIRVVLQVHALSFRKPDAPFARPPQRLPVAVPGLPIPQIDWLTVDRTTNPPARIRLARYDGRQQRQPIADAPERPVLLIHGYSASGTTFVHHSVPGNLVQVLCELGRDVWVLDMRSSAGLDTAVADWSFEMMASQDIPVAIEHILSATGTLQDRAVRREKNKAVWKENRIDVVAHCMGAAMFSMAILEDKDRNHKENCLHKKIGRVVFSQIGPAMQLSRTNVLAAYIMRYVRDFLPLENYSFSPQKVSTAGQFLDRALATMSMPPDEYRRENPLWPPGKATPWVGTRHRMDALYGRTFRLKNMDNRTLEHIDDFFGPLSVETVSQVLHFAAVNCVTDTRGINRYVTPERVKERLRFPMMSIHGEKNGLADPATMAIMRNMLEKAGVPYLNELAPADRRRPIRWLFELCSWRALARHFLGEPRPANEDPVAAVSHRKEIERLIDLAGPRLVLGEPSYLTWLIEDHGHQDCLIGKDAKSICEVIARYLGKRDAPRSEPSTPVGVATASPPATETKASEARTPAYGLRVTNEADNVIVRALDSSGRGLPLGALFVPVHQEGERFRMVKWGNGPGLRVYPPERPEREREVARELSKKKPVPEEDIVTLYAFEVPHAEWPPGLRILVLLLYDQSEGVGGSPRPPRSTGDKSILTLVDEALTHDSVDELRGGLICCAPAGPEPERAIADRPQRVTFALASCQYPSDIFNRMPEGEHATRGPVDRSLLALSDRLNEPNPPTLLLLCGDQVYTDATAGLFDPKISDQRFRIPHERRGQSRGSMAVMQRRDLRVEMMLDDHEIRDNWAPNDPDPEVLGSGKTVLERGRLAYFRYERGLLKAPSRAWHTIEHNGLPFFLGDTRTERKGRTVLNWRDVRIMSPKQSTALCEWLKADGHKDRPKFILTASALLPRRMQVTEKPARALHSDNWEGYPASMHALLKFICDNEIRGVVFLSGDEHLSNLVTATVKRSDRESGCTLHSVHSSALYAPYPVANAVPQDFKGDEIFCFPDPEKPGRLYYCDVKTYFAPGDGFAVLAALSDRLGWHLDVDFYNAAGVKKNDKTITRPLGLHSSSEAVD
jgi:choline dehydrogenase-like flavoprotein